MGRLADDEVARHAEMGLSHAVGKQIAAIMHVLHGDLRGDVIDDLAQEGIVAVALLLELAALRDVFDRGDPAAMRQRLADGQKGMSVRTQHRAVIDLAACDIPQNSRTEFIDVAVEGSRVLAVLYQIVEMAARLHDIRRQVEHVDVALVDRDDAPGGVVHHQPLDHVVQRGVEPMPFGLQPLLRVTTLPGDLPDDQEQDQGDHHGRQHGRGHEESGLRAPVLQRCGNRVGRDDDDREAAQLGRRSEPVRIVDRAAHAQRLLAALAQDPLQQRRGLEFLSDHLIDVRITRQQGPVGVEHRDGSPRAHRDRSKEFLVIGGVDAPRHHAEEGAVFPA